MIREQPRPQNRITRAPSHDDTGPEVTTVKTIDCLRQILLQIGVSQFRKVFRQVALDGRGCWSLPVFLVQLLKHRTFERVSLFRFHETWAPTSSRMGAGRELTRSARLRKF